MRMHTVRMRDRPVNSAFLPYPITSPVSLNCSATCKSSALDTPPAMVRSVDRDFAGSADFADLVG